MTLRRVLVGGVLPVLLLAVVALGLWGAVEGARAVGAARDTRASAAALEQALRSGSWDAAAQEAGRLRTGVDRMETALSSPPLRVAGVLPVVGRDVRAAREVALGLQEASRGAQPLLDATRGLTAGSLLTDGRIDIERLQRLAPAAAAADRGLTSAQRRIAAIDASTLHQPLRGQVVDLQRRLGDLQARGATALLATRQLPTMLGGEGRRTYLVAVQNPAEARPTGGVFGAYGVLAAEDGRLQLVDAGTAARLRASGGDGPVRAQDVNLSPDFPAAARSLERLWRGTGRDAADGVLSADPVALQAIVRRIGSVPVGGGPMLTGDNTSAVLMEPVDRLLRADPVAREAYLAQAASAVLARIIAPGSGISAVWKALSAPGPRRHVMAWTREPRENALLRRLGVSGELPAPDAASVGVYVTNADASNFDFYLRRTLTVAARCGPNGPQLTLRLGNGAPSSHTVTVALYLPPERGLRRLTVNGRPAPYDPGRDRGWTTARATVTVPRGAAMDVRAELSGAGPVTTVHDQPAVTPLGRVDVPCRG